jgi:hypothetical protein
MTVIPTVNAGAVSITCGNGHTNPLAISAITRPPAGLGPPFAVLTVTCPTCGESSSHPVSGGADQASVQTLFVTVVAANGCPCGALTAGKAAALVRSHLRSHAQQLGGTFP